MTGASNFTTTSNSFGSYSVNNLQPGAQYAGAPAKNGDANGITAFDATLVLRHVAANGQGANALNANQQSAADTNNDALLTAFDATQILRYVAANGANANTGQAGNWKFLPASRTYNAMNNSLSGENYEAVLIGEVSGDWTPPGGNALAEAEIETRNQSNAVSADGLTNSEAVDAEISVSTDFARASDGAVLIPIGLTNYAGKNISAYNFEVRFDSSLLVPDTEHPVEQNETLSQNFAIDSDTARSGKIGIAAASGETNRNQAASGGVLLYLRFKIKKAEIDATDTTIPLNFTRKPVFEDENGETVSVAAQQILTKRDD